MFNWLRRRRLSDTARKRLLVLSARAEDAIIETHVANLIDLLETLGDEIDLERGLELYGEMMSLDETVAAAVTNRLLTRLEDSEPTRKRDQAAARYRDVFREPRR